MGKRGRVVTYPLFLIIDISFFYISYTNPTISYSRARNAWLYCFVAVPTLISYPWRIDDAPLGHQKAFYLNPIDYLKE